MQDTSLAMIIFGRWSLWASLAIIALVLAVSMLVSNPVIGLAFIAVIAILALAAWRNWPSDWRW
jgi:hypothetical protein